MATFIGRRLLLVQHYSGTGEKARCIYAEWDGKFICPSFAKCNA